MKKVLTHRKSAVARLISLSFICFLIVAGTNSCKKELAISHETEKADGLPVTTVFSPPNAKNLSFKDFLDQLKKSRQVH